MPKTAPFDFMKDGVTWVASKLSGAAGALEEKAVELRKWLICFRYTSEELMVVLAELYDCMSNYPPLPPPGPPNTK